VRDETIVLIVTILCITFLEAINMLTFGYDSALLNGILMFLSGIVTWITKGKVEKWRWRRKWRQQTRYFKTQ